MNKLICSILIAGVAVMNTAVALTTTIDFEDLDTGTRVDGEYAISPLLSIYSNSEMQVVEEGRPSGLLAFNTDVYGTNAPSGINYLPGDDNSKSFGNDGSIQTQTGEDLEIVFNPLIVVSSFSIDLADYGDWFPLGGTDPRTVNLQAFGYDNSLLATEKLEVSKNRAQYDASLLTLSVEAEDIASVTLTFEDMDNGIGFDNVTVSYTNVPVNIDIKPGSYPNSFNINGNGVIPVAILGSADFDVYTIDTETLKLGGLEVAVRGKDKLMVSYEDVNGDYSESLEGAPDGYMDLVIKFEDDPDMWAPGEGTATLTGSLNDGTPILGVDSINVVQ